MPGLVPGIHVFLDAAKTWMAGTSPAMTENVVLTVTSHSVLDIAGVTLLADLSGALFWEEQSLLVVSDLHLEKGSSFAARGVLLPPYDTVATLSRLAAVIARHDPRVVIALGDSFHDRDAHERLSEPDREALTAMQVRRDWVWISGNHDPHLPSDLGVRRLCGRLEHPRCGVQEGLWRRRRDGACAWRQQTARDISVAVLLKNPTPPSRAPCRRTQPGDRPAAASPGWHRARRPAPL